MNKKEIYYTPKPRHPFLHAIGNIVKGLFITAGVAGIATTIIVGVTSNGQALLSAFQSAWTWFVALF